MLDRILIGALVICGSACIADKTDGSTDTTDGRTNDVDKTDGSTDTTDGNTTDVDNPDFDSYTYDDENNNITDYLIAEVPLDAACTSDQDQVAAITQVVIDGQHKYCIVQPAGAWDRAAQDLVTSILCGGSDQCADSVKYQYDKPLVVPLAGRAAMKAFTKLAEKRSKALLPRVEGAPASTGPNQPMLAILDTPENPSTPCAGGTFRRDHGAALGRIAQHILTNAGGSMVANVRRYPALRLHHWSARGVRNRRQSTTCNASYGSFRDLADAIMQATRDHTDEKRTGQLVLNLSLGWTRQAAPGPLLLGEKMVRAALSDATCSHGALAFAAAGNRHAGDMSRTGPMLPAAWAATETCPGNSTPIVVAVGSVDPDGEAIHISRDQALPPLVGLGDRVSIGGEAPMTGTSVGTQVVSASAALRAAYQPERGLDLLLALYDSGNSTGASSSCCSGPALTTHSRRPNPQVHQITPCAAAATKCSSSSSGPIPDLDLWIEKELAGSPMAKTRGTCARTAKVSTPPLCPILSTSGREHLRVPAMVPQPEDEDCFVCSFSLGLSGGGGQLHLNDDWGTAPDVYVELFDKTGAPQATVPLSAFPTTGAYSYDVGAPPSAGWGEAHLHYAPGTGGHVSSIIVFEGP